MIYINQYEEIFKALSDTNRLKILNILSEKNMCGCNILEKLDITQPTLSHHLKVLNDCKLIMQVKKGNRMIYQLDKNTLNDIKKYLDTMKGGN